MSSLQDSAVASDCPSCGEIVDWKFVAAALRLRQPLRSRGSSYYLLFSVFISSSIVSDKVVIFFMQVNKIQFELLS